VLHRAQKVIGAAIHAVDGEIGTVEDFYFEEDDWTVRYLLVDTGKWLSGKKVLLSPAAVKGPWTMAEVPVTLTRDQVWQSPAFDGRHPDGDRADHHLRSTKESTGYHLHAADGEIGHVDDFLIGEDSWKIRYLLVDTSNWIGGKSVVVASEALDGVDTDNGTLKVAATRDAVRHSPKFASIEDAIGPAENGPPFVII
jgi:PRC-barrel domain